MCSLNARVCFTLSKARHFFVPFLLFCQRDEKLKTVHRLRRARASVSSFRLYTRNRDVFIENSGYVVLKATIANIAYHCISIAKYVAKILMTCETVFEVCRRFLLARTKR